MLKYLYHHRFLFIVYPFDWRDESYNFNTRAHQRWEQCLSYIDVNIRPGLELLQSKSSERDSSEVTKFTRGVVNDFIQKIKTVNESVLSDEVKSKVVQKLESIDYLPGLFAHNFTEKRLEEFYADLDLKGNEKLVEMALKIEGFHKKLLNDYKGSEISLDSSASSDAISYNTITDELGKF